jgi:hypothetical protein
LAKSIEHAEELKSLHRRLMDELSSTGDPRVSADIIFERSPFTDAFSKNNARRK